MLIDARQRELIEHTLLWCPDQWRGVTLMGRRLFTRSAPPVGAAYYMLPWGVDPLALMEGGESALLFAVQNETCPQRMVAECIRLGLVSHQPLLTATLNDSVDAVLSANGKWMGDNTSPFLSAIMRDLPAVTRMLYESGSCSYRELFRLHEFLPKLTQSGTREERELRRGMLSRQLSSEITDIIQKSLPYLEKVATTPRSLTSTCRIAVSHSLNVCSKRHKDIKQFPLPVSVRNYVIFSDLNNPDYGKNVMQSV